MSDLINKIKDWITPATVSPEESIKELQSKTQKLEQQADFAETKAKLIDRANKAKKRIRATKSYPHINTRLIVIGAVLLGVIILIMVKGC